MGPGFISPDDFSLPFGRDCHRGLQWGRASSARMTLERVAELKEAMTASMGPGFISPDDCLG